MRAFATSVRRSDVVAKWRTALRFPAGPDGSKPWRSRLIWEVPRNVESTCAIAEVMTQCAHGYSGWFGVARSGRHPGTSTVAELPSLTPGVAPKPSALTEVGSIAVTGRQNR